MDKQVLVVYASKYGATAEIAEKIGQVLRKAGLHVDVSAVGKAGDLDAYDAVVVGSGVYIGKWLKEAARFLQRNEQTLAKKPVWLFSSGPTGDGDPAELMQGWTFPEDLKPLAGRIGPRDVGLFHGSVDLDKLNFLHKFMIKNVDSPVGDYRDWDAIAAWAASIAEGLGAAETAPETPAT